MALLGQAALAMWWDIDAGMRGEFEDWHTHEHFPERLSVPGFRRATRWRDAGGGAGFFVMYELADHAVLSSPPYLARLNAPSPWSTKMMPHHRNMVRTQCRVLESRGGAVASAACTVRLSPPGGRDHELRTALRALIDDLVARPGIAGAHLLQHNAPAIAATEEQRIRGFGDRAADWIFVVVGYDGEVLQGLSAGHALSALGAVGETTLGFYSLSCSATAADIN